MRRAPDAIPNECRTDTGSDEEADRLTRLLSDRDLGRRIAAYSVEAARRRFDLRRQVDAYLDWYAELTRPARPREG